MVSSPIYDWIAVIAAIVFCAFIVRQLSQRNVGTAAPTDQEDELFGTGTPVSTWSKHWIFAVVDSEKWSAILRSLVHGPLLYGLLAYTTTTFITVYCANFVFKLDISVSLTDWHVVAGLGLVLSLWGYSHFKRSTSLYWQSLWGVFIFLVARNLITKQASLLSYGDRGFMEAILQSGDSVPKWLIGSTFTNWLYAAVWQFPPLQSWLPVDLQPPHGFIASVSALMMGLSSIMLFQRGIDRLSIILPLITPIWIMFSTGYSEIYPFVVPVFVVVLSVLFENRLESKSPLLIGLIAAALPLVYLGFAPISVLLLFFYMVSNRKDSPKAFGYCILSFVLLLTIFWSGSKTQFFSQLYSSMNLGEQNVLFERYKDHSAGANSIFFEPRYALSAEHLTDAFYILFFGGGAIPLILLAAGALYYLASGVDKTILILKDVRLWMALAVIAIHIHYLLFMIPKLGPVQDIDLFFQVFIVLAFFAGYVWDALQSNRDQKEGLQFVLVSIMFGYSLVVLHILLFVGLPPR